MMHDNPRLNRKRRIGARGRKAAPLYSALLEEWLALKRLSLKESSLQRYRYLVDHYIARQLGELEVAKITSEDIVDFADFLRNAGRSDQSGGLAPKTVIDILAIVRSTIRYAQKRGIPMNCAIDRALIPNRPREMRVLSPEEQERLTNYLVAKRDRYCFGVLLSLYMGLRVGEICALRWSDVDLPELTLHVRHTLQRLPQPEKATRTRILLSAPKTASSRRDIPIPACLKSFFQEFAGCPDEFLVSGSQKPVEPRTLQYHFHRYLAAASVERANFHALRHTFATRCVEAGFEIKSLSEILGHSSVNITLNRYVHSSMRLKIENMNKMSL